ncbi:MAG TPA: hypothetical protein VK548_18485 [Candidatus Acidoferrum sp.]|nr:hypothetical protein [Candidatus Acidoferrum sp.]
MKRYVCLVGAMAILLTATSIPYATSNLNLSKSNVNVVVADPDAASAAQTTAILSEVDRLPPGADEAAVRKVVEKHVSAVKSARGGDLVIRVRALPQNRRAILILKNAADEEAALMKAGYDLKQNKQQRAPSGAPRY